MEIKNLRTLNLIAYCVFFVFVVGTVVSHFAAIEGMRWVYAKWQAYEYEQLVRRAQRSQPLLTGTDTGEPSVITITSNVVYISGTGVLCAVNDDELDRQQADTVIRHPEMIVTGTGTVGWAWQGIRAGGLCLVTPTGGYISSTAR